MQAAIDNCKRTYNIDIPAEIKRIKKDMDIQTNGYPQFWKCIRPDFHGYINTSLQCPMNEVAKFRMPHPSHKIKIISNRKFFIKYNLTTKNTKCKKVEDLIQKYSFKLMSYNTSSDKEYDDYLLLRNDFEQMIEDIRKIYLSNNYLGLMSWLIDRSLRITPMAVRTASQVHSNIHKNRALLMKTLYSVSPNQFLQCFTGKNNK